MALKNKRYLIIIAVSLFIAVAIVVSLPRVFSPERSKVAIPPPPSPPLRRHGEAHGITVKKQFGETTLIITAGTMKPHRVQPGNILEFMMDAEYKLRLKNVKLNLMEGQKSLELKADAAFSNEDFTRIKIKGIYHISQKGFNLRPIRGAMKLTIKDGKVQVIM